MLKNNKVIAIPPGYTIKEQLEDRNINLNDFIVKMNMSKEDVELLIEGKIKLTNDLAYKLELVLGLPKQFWINLENNYRNKLDIIKKTA